MRRKGKGMVAIEPRKDWGGLALLSSKCRVLTSADWFFPGVCVSGPFRSTLPGDQEVKLQPKLNCTEWENGVVFEACEGCFLGEVCSEHWVGPSVSAFCLSSWFSFPAALLFLRREPDARELDWRLKGSESCWDPSQLWQSPATRETFVGPLLSSPRCRCSWQGLQLFGSESVLMCLDWNVEATVL